MLVRIRRIWDRLQGSLWFSPLLIVAICIGASFGMVALDRVLGDQIIRELPVLFDGGPEGTREMLSTIAGSVLSVAAVAFSFTIAVFSLASNQYSSRTVHNFMDDNTNQVVLGVLLGTFGYCLLVLRTVRLESEQAFVPVLSTSLALVLAIVCLALFVLFIHHVSESIQAYHILNRVGTATRKAIENQFSNREATGMSKDDASGLLDDENTVEVRSQESGYIQGVDTDNLVKLAEQRDLVITMQKDVGRFVVRDEPLAVVGPASRVHHAVEQEIRRAFAVGQHRTIFQDPLYGLLQLSDIAIKALSPSINDPNTAIMSLNEISSVLRALVEYDTPSHVLCDKSGAARVITRGPTFDSMASQAFDQIRRYGAGDAAVAAKMLDVIADVAERAGFEEQRTALARHVLAIREDADRKLDSMRDRLYLNERLVPAAACLDIEALVAPLSPSPPSGAAASG